MPLLVRAVAVSLIRPDEDPPVHPVGTAVRLLEVRTVQHAARGASLSGPSAIYVIVVQGVERLTFDAEAVADAPYLRLRAQCCEPSVPLDRESATAYSRALQDLAHEVLRTLQRVATLGDGDGGAAASAKVTASLLAMVGRSGRMDGAMLSLLVDGLASSADVSADEKQAVLRAATVGERADLVIAMLQKQLEVLRLSAKVAASARGDVSRSHKEHWLRQQLKVPWPPHAHTHARRESLVLRRESPTLSSTNPRAQAIRDELHADSAPSTDADGGGADPADDVAEIKARLAHATLPPVVRTAAERELRRLRQMQPMHAEYAVLLNYLDWICALPWAAPAQSALDLARAHEVTACACACTRDLARAHEVTACACASAHRASSHAAYSTRPLRRSPTVGSWCLSSP